MQKAAAKKGKKSDEKAKTADKETHDSDAEDEGRQ